MSFDGIGKKYRIDLNFTEKGFELRIVTLIHLLKGVNNMNNLIEIEINQYDKIHILINNDNIEININRPRDSGDINSIKINKFEKRKLNLQNNDIIKEQNKSERNKIFISYSKKDKKWLERVKTHLSALNYEGYNIEEWDDRKIEAGDKWMKEIEKALETTKIAVLLVSADFLATEFIRKIEIVKFLKAAENDGAVILPVIISPCRFNETKEISQFQAINSSERALSKLSKPEQEEELVKLTREIEKYF